METVEFITMLSQKKLNELEIGEQITFSGRVQAARNLVNRFHRNEEYENKRFRVIAEINLIVRVK